MKHGPTTGIFAQINLPALSNGEQWNTGSLYGPAVDRAQHTVLLASKPILPVRRWRTPISSGS
jgi:hypothetical protein